MHKESESLYSIQFVANVTGINPHTIRAWEKRYGVTVPTRDKNGRRLYSDQEIQKLDLLYKLVNIGNNISDIANLSREQLVRVLEKYDLRKNEIKQKKNGANDEFGWRAHYKNIVAALKLSEVDVIYQELNLCCEEMGKMDFIKKVLIPIFGELHQLIEKNFYDMRYLKSITHILKSFIYKRFSLTNKSKAGRKVVIVTSENEFNDIAGFIAAFAFDLVGDDVSFIGRENDIETVLNISKVIRPDVIFLATDYAPYGFSSVERCKEYVSEIVKFNSSSEILVGSHNIRNFYQELDIKHISSFERLFSAIKST